MADECRGDFLGIHPLTSNLHAGFTPAKHLQVAAGVQDTEIARIVNAHRHPAIQRQFKKTVFRDALTEITEAQSGASDQNTAGKPVRNQTVTSVDFGHIDVREVSRSKSQSPAVRVNYRGRHIMALGDGIKVTDRSVRQRSPCPRYQLWVHDLAAQHDQTQSSERAHRIRHGQASGEQCRGHHRTADIMTNQRDCERPGIPHHGVRNHQHRNTMMQRRYRVPDAKDVAAHHVVVTIRERRRTPGVRVHRSELIGDHRLRHAGGAA